VSELRIERAAGDTMLEDWRHIHNVIIPTDPLSLEQVRERSGRNRLDVAYLDDTPVGCMTVRPPSDESPAVTVIARVLPRHRGRGWGTRLYEHGLAEARRLGAETVETIILASNVDGLRFALSHGFVEVERYLLPGATIPYVTLRAPLPSAGGGAA
jgi:GNAT superfamily N-acetyltransferase